MITIENIGSKIYLFERDKEGNSKVIIDRDFKPYFYYKDKNGIYKSIDDVKCSKKICNSPADIKELRENYNETFESDVVYTNRYIIDKYEEIPKQKVRLCYLDIEIQRTESGYESAELANNPILSICCYDNFSGEYMQFVLKDYKGEKEMLISFAEYIKCTDPDIFIAWNGDSFDFPFIINRFVKLNIGANKLARGNGQCRTHKYGVSIFGRICFDLMNAYKKHFSMGGRESWSLDYISKYELKELGGKEKYTGELDDLYNNNLELFKTYNKRDVELMVLINEKLGIFEFFDEVRRQSFCKIEDVFMNSKTVDCLCLKYALKHNYVLPRVKNNSSEESFSGAFVRDSEPKLHYNVSVMDMKSLYPSIMIGFNCSYETLLDNKTDDCINMKDKFYYKKERGIIPSIVQPLLSRRKQIAKQMNEAREKFGMESREYKTLYSTQYALKVIANSIYGVLGFKNFRLYKKDVAQSITFMAQEIIKEVHNWFESKGFNIIYGDTDSCFIEMKSNDIEHFSNLNVEINKYFIDFFKLFNVEEEYNIFKLEFEKVFSTVFFKAKGNGDGVKKKYAGRMIWYDGKKVDKILIVGFESKRSDYPAIGRKFLSDVLKYILEEKDKQEIDEYIKEFRNNILSGKYTADELGMPISISKNLSSYANQVHAKAARRSNELYNMGIKQGDKIKYIYTKDGGAIAFKSYCPEDVEVNYDKMVSRIVDMKISPIYKSLGWEYEYAELKIKSERRSNKIPTFEQKMKQMGLWD